MWQDLDGLGGAGVNSGAHQVDQFGATGKETGDYSLIHLSRCTQQPGETWVLPVIAHALFLLFYHTHVVNKTKSPFSRRRIGQSIEHPFPLRFVPTSTLDDARTIQPFDPHLSTRKRCILQDPIALQPSYRTIKRDSRGDTHDTSESSCPVSGDRYYIRQPKKKSPD